MKLAFFGYAWGPAGKLDAYMEEFVHSLQSLGMDVDVYFGNYFTAENILKEISPSVLMGKFLAHLKAQKYDLAISFNNALITTEIINALRCKVVTYIVDDFLHLFNHEGGDKFTPFRNNIEIFTLATEIEEQILRAIPGVRPRLHFFPTATHISSQNKKKVQYVYPVSWVASYLDSKHIETLFKHALPDEKKSQTLKTCLHAIERNAGKELTSLTDNHDIESLLTWYKWPLALLDMQLQNLVSNQHRVGIVNKLSKHGLALFGNPGWSHSFSSSKHCVKSFQAGLSVKTHQQLMDIYNTSKISINAPQIQAGSALQYRVVDIMASNALLITKYHENSDAFRIFGKDCPVPMYHDLEELEKLCAYYLEHEEERLALVAKCNALVAKGFSFRERCLDILKVAGIDERKLGSAEPGMIHHISITLFLSNKSVLHRFLLPFARRLMIQFIRFTTTPYMRKRIINLISSVP